MISQCLSSGTSQLITLDVMLQDDAKLALFCIILLFFGLVLFLLQTAQAEKNYEGNCRSCF